MQSAGVVRADVDPRQVAYVLNCIRAGMVFVEELMPPGVVPELQQTLNHRWLLQRILSHRGPSNLVMITHDLDIANVVLEGSVGMGEFFVLQPTGTDFTVVGRIRPSH